MSASPARVCGSLLVALALGCSGGAERDAAIDPSTGAQDASADAPSDHGRDGSTDQHPDDAAVQHDPDAGGPDVPEGPLEPADPNVPDVDCGDAVLEGNALIETADDWAELEGITHVTGRLEVYSDADVPPLQVLCVDVGLALWEIEGTPDLSGLASIKRVGDLTVAKNRGVTSLEGLSGLMHVTGNMLIDENQGLLTLEGLSSLARVDGWVRVWRNMGFQSLAGLERLARIGDKLWVANQPLENLEGLRGLGYVKGVQLVSVSGLTSLRGMRALTRIDDGLFLDEAHQLTNLAGLEYVKELAYNLDIDGAQNLRSLEGLGVTRFGEGISVRRTGVEDLTALYAAVEVKGDVNFDTNPSLAQCEVDALEQKLRSVGWEGMMFSDATGGACDP